MPFELAPSFNNMVTFVSYCVYHLSIIARKVTMLPVTFTLYIIIIVQFFGKDES